MPSSLIAIRTLIVTLPQRVKLARTKRGLTQRELAERTRGAGGPAAISPGYVSMLEKETGEPNAVESPGLLGLKKIAEALLVPEEWLILGQGDEPTWEPNPLATADDVRPDPPASERKPTGAPPALEADGTDPFGGRP